MPICVPTQPHRDKLSATYQSSRPTETRTSVSLTARRHTQSNCATVGLISLVVPLDRGDVDTDQIIPKQFLKRIERTGYGQFLFFDWANDAQGERVPDFVLNQPAYEGASILLTGRNFGCGSSREHAAWSVLDYGFRVVIAPSFADIFRNNADQNGLMAVELCPEEVETLMSRAAAGNGYRVSVDLEQKVVRDAEGFEAHFQIGDFRRDCLLQGLDRIGLTLRHEESISAFEEARAS